jgi:hypothetical protein
VSKLRWLVGLMVIGCCTGTLAQAQSGATPNNGLTLPSRPGFDDLSQQSLKALQDYVNQAMKDWKADHPQPPPAQPQQPEDQSHSDASSDSTTSYWACVVFAQDGTRTVPVLSNVFEGDAGFKQIKGLSGQQTSAVYKYANEYNGFLRKYAADLNSHPGRPYDVTMDYGSTRCAYFDTSDAALKWNTQGEHRDAPWPVSQSGDIYEVDGGYLR